MRELKLRRGLGAGSSKKPLGGSELIGISEPGGGSESPLVVVFEAIRGRLPRLFKAI